MTINNLLGLYFDGLDDEELLITILLHEILKTSS